ncbi:MAG: DoxX family protein [Parafilimonas sp.]
MEKALASISIIAGLIFLFAGSLKLFIAKNKLKIWGVKGLEFAPSLFIKLLGLAEITGAAITILSLFITLPNVILKICLVGLALLMVSATIFHIMRKEFQNASMTSILVVAIICLLVFK